MPSLESNCEAVIVAILSASADLIGFQIVQKDEDTAANEDRIVVSASPKEVEKETADGNRVAIDRIMVSVEVFFVTRAADTYDGVISAIETAMSAATPPAAAIAAWITAFPNGGRIEQTSDGADETGGNTRTRSKTFRVFHVTGFL